MRIRQKREIQELLYIMINYHLPIFRFSLQRLQDYRMFLRKGVCMKKYLYWQTCRQPILICCCSILLIATIHPVLGAFGAPDEVWNNTYGGPLNDYGYGVNVASWAPITIVGSAGGNAYRETVDSSGTQWENGTYGTNSTYYGVTDVPWELGVADAAFVMVGKRASTQGANGRKIAFYSLRDGNYEIYVMYTDGTSQTRLTNNPADDERPVWSPDGNKIAFTSNRDGNFEIYVMNVDGTNPTRLTNNPASDIGAVWSPDGNKIAFFTNRDGNNEIYVMNADGTSQTRLTNNPADDRLPDWSPDGTKIVFSSSRNGFYEIYVMNADGTSPTLLTNTTAGNDNPVWSPDGNKIAFFTDRDGNLEIYVMNANGTSPTRLTTNTVGDWTPFWSPDGNKIAFSSNRDGNYEIYVMNSDGTNPTRLTNNPATDISPAWSHKPSEAIVRKVPWKTYPQNSFSVTYGPPVYYDAALKAVHNTYNPLQQDLFYVAGGHTSSAYDAPSDAWLVEIGVGGGINWSRSYGGSNDDWINEFIQTSDGSFTLVGGTQSYGPGIPTQPNIYLVRTDANGNLVWEKAYGGPNSETGNDVLVTADGGYLIVGDTFASGNQSDIWLIRTDSSGNMVWDKTFGGSGTDSGKALHNTTDGLGYVIVGSTSSYGNGASDIWMIRVDTSGNEVWNRTFGGTGNDEGYDVDGFLDGYVISGSTTSLGAGGSDLWLIRTGPEKNIPDTSITVIQPPPSYFYRQGTPVLIAWQYTGNPGSAVKIELLNGSVVNSTLTASTPIGSAGQGNYTWTIPLNQPAATDYRVKITSTTSSVYNDTSDAFFEIAEWIGVNITVPNGGESWAAGSTHLITWQHKNTGAPIVQIELFKGGVRDHIINTSAPIGAGGNGSYSWTIPQTQTPGTDYSMRVWSNPNGYTDNSNAPFTITATTDSAAHSGVFRDSNGIWYLDTTNTGVVNRSFQFGKSGDVPVTGDWNGDGITDAGVFRPATGIWYLDTSKTGVVNKSFQFGKLGDTPLIGDWDGNGISDVGVFRQSTGTWYLDTTKAGVINKTFQFGKSGDIPVVGDWNADGISDSGIFRPVTGIWYLDITKTGVISSVFQFGKSGDIPVTGDWNSDGVSDSGVFRPAAGTWYLETTKNGVVSSAFQFGKSGDQPAIVDWNGDGISDVGVFRPSTGSWYFDTTKTGAVNKSFQFGKNGDTPVIGKWI
jgi:dipeptidyl aminopeptidase/acylaminoacyl peptidase